MSALLQVTGLFGEKVGKGCFSPTNFVYTPCMENNTTTLITRTARQTGTLITVGSADELLLDDCNGQTKWYTICETHFTAIGHQNKSMATMFSSVPKEWCEYCAGTCHWCAAHQNDSDNCECEVK